LVQKEIDYGSAQPQEKRMQKDNIGDYCLIILQGIQKAALRTVVLVKKNQPG